jgi:predicted nucleotidyltransferase
MVSWAVHLRWNSTRSTFPVPVVTPMHTRPALHGVAISVQKRKGWSSMRQRSSGSVKVFYPPWNREALLVRLREGVIALREVLPLVRVVLFGSYARGRQTVASDIDLLVVYAGAAQGDAYALVRRTLDIRHLEPHVYAEEEYAQGRDTLERMVQDGIPVYSAGVAADCQPGGQRTDI